VNNRIKSLFGKTFLILGYIVLLPIALAIIVMLFFPPTWIPLLVVGGIIWFFMKDSTKKKATGLLKIAGGSLVSGLILIGLVNVSGSKSSSNNATPHIPTAISKSQTHSLVQKSTTGPTVTATAELEKKHQAIIQTQQNQRAIAKEWWDKNRAIITESGEDFFEARKYLGTGDNSTSMMAFTDATNLVHSLDISNPPDGWKDVASDLSAALSGIDDCYSKLKEEIIANDGNTEPSNSSSCTKLTRYLNKAQYDVGYHWATMGGTLADL
jgi:hypothetical protein